MDAVTSARMGTERQWRRGLPTLVGGRVALRELRMSDAASLAKLLTTADVVQFIAAPPPTAAGFERFITWTHDQRREGKAVCFGIVPRGRQHAVGVLQLRMDPTGTIGEAGVVLASSYWGTGLFSQAAELLLDWAFDEVGLHRVEARIAAENGRATGAVVKLGGVREGMLRRSLDLDGRVLDQLLWSILESDRPSKAVWGRASRFDDALSTLAA